MEVYKAFLQDSTDRHPFTAPGLSRTPLVIFGNPGWDDERWILSWDLSHLLVNDWYPATTLPLR